jgi:hypothetical protein
MQNLSFVIRPLKRISKTAKIWASLTTKSAARLCWYRHVTLVLLAAAYLVGICAQAHASCPVAALSMPVVLPLTVPEVRHLLARLIWPASSSVRRVLAWSWWRRVHQSWASYYHTKRRLKASQS